MLKRKEVLNDFNLLRSLMFVPAHNDKLLDKAIKAEADVLLLDVEDSVMPKEKNNLLEIILSNICKRKNLNN